MRKHIHLSLLLTLAFACVCSASGYAQSSKAATGAANEPVALFPANVRVSSDLRADLAKLWRRSSTFRWQCERIAAAPGLTVKLESTLRAAHTLRGYRALTTYKRRPDGAAHALIRLVADSRLPELVGHEFEHVLEQLEGWSLRTLAHTDAGVSRNKDGCYETERARATGRQIFDEYLAARAQERRAAGK